MIFFLVIFNFFGFCCRMWWRFFFLVLFLDVYELLCFCCFFDRVDRDVGLVHKILVQVRDKKSDKFMLWLLCACVE